MSVIKTIGNNIRELMNESNISVRKLAEVINVTHPTMSKYINGEQAIDSERLYIIADYFNKSFDYFFREKHEERPVMFRADKPKENLEQYDYSYMLRKIEEYIDIIENDNLVYIPQSYTIKIDGSQLSEENENAIEKIAKEQRRLLGIENRIPDNYYNVISKVGIHVLCFELKNKTLFGASSYAKGHGSFIFVNSNESIPEERQIFSLIHELGHLLFHQNEYLNPKYNPLYEKTRGNTKEKVADSFAGYFLLPKDMVKEYIKERDGKISPFEMKKHFKVSIHALFLNLHKYGLISDDVYQGFWKRVHQNKWNKTEPEPLDHMSFEKKNEKLVIEIMKLYDKDEISINKISEFLELDIIDTRRLVKEWGRNNDVFETIL